MDGDGKSPRADVVELGMSSLPASSLAQALVSEHPDPELADELALFGQFVGVWDLEVVYHRPDGSTERHPGEWTFGWVLDGRAIQDVWRVPPRGQGTAGRPRGFGATLRLYDPALGAWHVRWFSAVTGAVTAFVAQRVGDEIVLEGTGGDEELTRWIFSEITPTTFRWRNVFSTDGETWELQQEMTARRREP